MLTANGVFARFTAMSAHLSILITIFKERDQYTGFCGYTDSGFRQLTDTRFIIALSFSIALLVVELLIFLLGTSLLRNKVTFASTLFHSSGAIALSFMVLTRWCSVWIWPVFAICSVIPFFIEIINAIGHNLSN